MMELISKYPEKDDTPDFGYFGEIDHDEDDFDEFAEPVWKYDKRQTTDIFYPICTDEVLNNRYRIEHKLGHGGSSTVWMAHGFQDNQDVALRIMASGDSGEYEYHIQREICRNVQDISRFVIYLETFILQGENCASGASFPSTGSTSFRS